MPKNPAVWTGFFDGTRLRQAPQGDGTMIDRQTTDLQNLLQGLWLPLVTPFRNGELDEASLRRMVRHYASGPVDGLILAATSGEGMSLGSDELEQLVGVTRAEIARCGRYVPICLGLSGASTSRMCETLD